MQEQCTKIHDILDNAVPNWVEKTFCILAYLFNSASRQWQYDEVLAFQFLFLQNFKDTIPSNEACFMVPLIGLLLRLSNSLPFACPSPQPL